MFSQRLTHTSQPSSWLLALCCTTTLLLGGCSDEQVGKLNANPDGSFSLNSQDQATYSAQWGTAIPSFFMTQLSWQAPTKRSNGLPLSATEIKSYKIYYYQEGSAEQESNTPIAVDVGTQTRVAMPLDSAGRYFFAIATIDNEMRESARTDFVAVDVK